MNLEDHNFQRMIKTWLPSARLRSFSLPSLLMRLQSYPTALADVVVHRAERQLSDISVLLRDCFQLVHFESRKRLTGSCGSDSRAAQICYSLSTLFSALWKSLRVASVRTTLTPSNNTHMHAQERITGNFFCSCLPLMTVISLWLHFLRLQMTNIMTKTTIFIWRFQFVVTNHKKCPFMCFRFFFFF